MTQKLSYYQDFAEEIMENNVERNKKCAKIDEMYHLQWAWPGTKPNWMHLVISSDPHDALRTATRVLSTKKPKLTYVPLTNNPETQAIATRIEKVLLWQLIQASRRGRSTITRNVVHSCLRYDEMAAYVDYLPWRQKKTGKKKNQREYYGPFIVTSYNPQKVFSECSPYGVERVLLSQIVKAREFMDYWQDAVTGDLAADIESKKITHVTIFDYMDTVDRAVWAYGCSKDDIVEPTAPKPLVIMREEHKLPFMPWVVRAGGTTVDDEPEFQVTPLLDAVYGANMWDLQNIMETAQVSDVIARLEQPLYTVEGPNASDVEIDYSNPSRRVNLPPAHKIVSLQPAMLDERFAYVADRMGQRINKSTVARFLQNLETEQGMAFATINALTQTAVASLDPYKDLAQDSIADICCNMLRWIGHTGDSLVAYDTAEVGGFGEALNVQRDVGLFGQEMRVGKNDFDPDNLYLQVKLEAAVPTDYMGRVNAAVMLHRDLQYPLGRALGDLDVADPEEALKERANEDMDLANIAGKLAEIQAEYQLRIQQAQMMMQLQMQKAMQPPPQPEAPPNVRPAAGAFQPTYQNIKGQGFNPNQGGIAPAAINPQGTKEGLSLEDRRNQELAEELE